MTKLRLSSSIFLLFLIWILLWILPLALRRNIHTSNHNPTSAPNSLSDVTSYPFIYLPYLLLRKNKHNQDFLYTLEYIFSSKIFYTEASTKHIDINYSKESCLWKGIWFVNIFTFWIRPSIYPWQWDPLYVGLVDRLNLFPSWINILLPYYTGPFDN